MEFSVALLIFIFEFTVFLFIGGSSIQRYIRYRYIADLNLSLAFGLAIITAIQRYYITFLDDIKLITLIYRSLNFFLMVEIFFFYTAFTLYYKNEFTVSITVFGFITGILTGAFLYDPSFKVLYDEATKSYNGVYDSTLLLFIGPLIVFAFIRMVQPMLRKMRSVDNRKDRRQLLLMSLGITIILGWGVGAGFTSIASFRMIRPLLFALGWSIWFLSSRRNPFFLSISNAKPQSLYISDHTGHLYYNYDFEGEKNYEPEMVSALVTAINAFANDIFQTKRGVEQFKMGDSMIVTTQIDNYFFHLVVSNPDDTLVGMLKYFALESIGELNELNSHETADLNTLIRNTFSKLQIISKDITVLPEIEK
ncbi:MAG: hypothetical protein INQ03_22895 [Candidatus Heimdallarchaeota archaeon]|nr:hypothetical protein [Candidatus Heimdallarchaeota archaeon]